MLDLKVIEDLMAARPPKFLLLGSSSLLLGHYEIKGLGLKISSHILFGDEFEDNRPLFTALEQR